ncbi:MAG: hypothetical protein L6V95_01030 [Candidatus Melainabacteria bacterium]|nr:MAG: hypothetical protein L6V95_01030 [Candidatus Melainabacteria bacterium]
MNENYATIDAIENQMKIPRDNYVLMVGNHDHLALSAYAEEIDNDDVFKTNGNDVKENKNNQIPALSKELKLDENVLKQTKTSGLKQNLHIFSWLKILSYFLWMCLDEKNSLILK